MKRCTIIYHRDVSAKTGACNVFVCVLPVAVCVWAIGYILSMLSVGWYCFSLCRGNTTLVKALVIRLHSRITPGSGCRGRSFSRTSCRHGFNSVLNTASQKQEREFLRNAKKSSFTLVVLNCFPSRTLPPPLLV